MQVHVLQMSPVHVLQMSPVHVLQMSPVHVLQMSPVHVLQMSPVHVLQMSPVQVLQMSPVHVLQVQSSPGFTTCRYKLNKSSCRYNRITVVNLIGLLDNRFFNLSFDWLVLITLYIVVDIFIVITTIIRLLLSLCEI